MSGYKRRKIGLNKGNTNRKEIIMKKLVAILIAVLLATTSFAGVGDPNFVRVYENSKGAVAFNHQVHADVTKDCAFCHGQLEQFGGKVDKDFGHKACKLCHKKVNDHEGKNAPTICSGCHVK